MSKHPQKYPGLYAECKAAGLQYNTIYLRVKGGMSIADAIAMSVGKCGRSRGWSKKRVDPQAVINEVRKLPWERAGYVAVRPRDTAAVSFAGYTPPVRRDRDVPIRKRYIPRRMDDNSPPHIRDIREAFCAKFIATGEQDLVMLTQMKDYADACRNSHKNSQRVPAEHEGENLGGRKTPLRDDRRGDDQQLHDTPAP